MFQPKPIAKPQIEQAPPWLSFPLGFFAELSRKQFLISLMPPLLKMQSVGNSQVSSVSRNTWEGLCSSCALSHRGLQSADSTPKSHSPALGTFKQHVVNAVDAPWTPWTCCAKEVEEVCAWSGNSTCSEPIRFPVQCLFRELTASSTAA